MNVAMLWLYGQRISVTLAMRSLPEWADRWIRRLARNATPVRMVMVGALLVVVIVPSALYYREHARLVDSELAYQSFFMNTTSENHMLVETVRSLLKDRALLKGLLLEAGYPVYTDEGNLMLKVLATGYSSSVIETDDTPYITAANTRTRMGVVALSRDLLKRYTPNAPFSFGDRIFILGLGEFTVEDSMHHRWKQRMDIWFPSRREAFRFGKKNLYITKLTDTEETLGEPSFANGALQ